MSNPHQSIFLPPANDDADEYREVFAQAETLPEVLGLVIRAAPDRGWSDRELLDNLDYVMVVTRFSQEDRDKCARQLAAWGFAKSIVDHIAGKPIS
jgi:hypothetical protein